MDTSSRFQRGPGASIKPRFDGSGILLRPVAFRAFSRWLHSARGTVAAVQPGIQLTQPAGCVGGLKGAHWIRPASQLSDYSSFFVTLQLVVKPPLTPPYDPTNTAPFQPTTNLFFQASRLL